MAKKTFQGRPVVAGTLEGKATVSKQPFNTTASYMENVWAGNTKNAPCTDQDNKDLFKKDLAAGGSSSSNPSGVADLPSERAIEP